MMQDKNDNNFMENSKGHSIGHAPAAAFKNKDFFMCARCGAVFG